jgi:hypothetical protein
VKRAVCIRRLVSLSSAGFSAVSPLECLPGRIERSPEIMKLVRIWLIPGDNLDTPGIGILSDVFRRNLVSSEEPHEPCPFQGRGGRLRAWQELRTRQHQVGFVTLLRQDFQVAAKAL